MLSEFLKWIKVKTSITAHVSIILSWIEIMKHACKQNTKLLNNAHYYLEGIKLTLQNVKFSVLLTFKINICLNKLLIKMHFRKFFSGFYFVWYFNLKLIWLVPKALRNRILFYICRQQIEQILTIYDQRVVEVVGHNQVFI